MDVNQPDSKGRLPLIEAVRIKEPRFVDALLQYGALAKAKDPATGSSPLHVAFQQNMPVVSPAGWLVVAKLATPQTCSHLATAAMCGMP